MLDSRCSDVVRGNVQSTQLELKYNTGGGYYKIFYKPTPDRSASPSPFIQLHLLLPAVTTHHWKYLDNCSPHKRQKIYKGANLPTKNFMVIFTPFGIHRLSTCSWDGHLSAKILIVGQRQLSLQTKQAIGGDLESKRSTRR